MTVSSSPRGEHPGRPGTTWDTELAYVEVVVPDRDGDDESPFGWTEPAPRPNRAARRAAARAARRTR
ncbi:hypothetical protein V2S66_31505 [Streptomyces sp. V4-01]|uniref:Uncharacterized protein n=1 Tax=Actinacidiphila polyblastidii TaxID=3110430 RepID=A0ABU7PKX6_9ACTN|nr:hypothetical protein [Streptomyces sp. V4-01]